MSESRRCDKTEMTLEIDQDVQAVLEFMQSNIPAIKLVGTAEATAQMARLLWGNNSQEPVRSLSLTYLDLVGVQRQAASELALHKGNVDGDSAGAGPCL